MDGQRGRETFGRVALLLFGLGLGMAAVELGLRAASAFVGPRAAPIEGGRQTILALGDSHTYGVFFPAEQAWPGQLAARLEARAPGRYRVVNLGLPGTNSSEIATRLPDWLDDHRPAQVVLCVGVNNIWNRSDAERVAEAPWWEELRVLRLARLLRARFGEAEPERDDEAGPGAGRREVERRVRGRGEVAVEFRDAETGELLIRHEGNFDVHRPLPRSLALLRRDLTRIHAECAARGVRLVLLTYAEHPVDGAPDPAQRNHAAVNEVLRDFAAGRELPLVDAAARVGARLEAGEPVGDWFHPDGSHPTPRGYAEIAEAVAEVVSDAS